MVDLTLQRKKNRKEKMNGRKGFEISTMKKVVIKYGPYNMAHITYWIPVLFLLQRFIWRNPTLNYNFIPT